MQESPLRVVLDTNVLLRGLVVRSSAAASVRRAAEERLFLPLLSKPVIDEYRAVLTDDEIVAKFPEITPQIVELTIRRLRFIGDYVRMPKARFQYPRDPGDEKLIELAIESRATHLLSFDHDLLSLSHGKTDAGKRLRQRLPNLQIVEPRAFLERNGARWKLR